MLNIGNNMTVKEHNMIEKQLNYKQQKPLYQTQ